MKVNIVGRKLVKPLTPTPHTLRQHKLSFLDELAPPLYVTFVLYYPKSVGKDTHINNLEYSLAKTLSHFYTFAGRYAKNDQKTVECNDFGAEYIEAEALDITLLAFIAGLEKNHDRMIAHVLPLGNKVHVEDDDPLLAVQLTKFECGGVAIAVKVSHKIADAESVLSFLTMWSDVESRGRTAESITNTPNLRKGPSLLPSKSDRSQDKIPEEPPEDTTNAPRVLMRRFSFKNEAIERLRSKLGIGYDNRRVSKVVMVSALIAKALIDMDRSKYGRYRSCFITHAVNLRERTNPSIPRNSIGNFGTIAIAEIPKPSSVGFEGLVSLIGGSIRGRVQDCAELFDGDGRFNHGVILEPMEKMLPNFTTNRDEVNVMWFTDWSKFGFYDIDFGRGKPVMTGLGTYTGSKLIVLMGTRNGDGIEARVHFSEEDMIAFEQYEDIKIHAMI